MGPCPFSFTGGLKVNKVKGLAIGLFLTAISIAAVFFLVRRFAPDNVKEFFRV